MTRERERKRTRERKRKKSREREGKRSRERREQDGCLKHKPSNLNPQTSTTSRSFKATSRLMHLTFLNCMTRTLMDTSARRYARMVWTSENGRHWWCDRS